MSSPCKGQADEFESLFKPSAMFTPFVRVSPNAQPDGHNSALAQCCHETPILT